jgi:hypothetical protein
MIETRTSDASTGASAPEAPEASAHRQWLDRLLGSDPGFNRLRSALLSVISIGIILAAEAVFVRLSDGLQIVGVASLPAADAVKAAASNHEHLVVMMLLGALVGLTSSFGVSDPRARGQLLTMLLLPVPLVASLALGLALGANRVLCLVLLVVISVIGTYLRRFPPPGDDCRIHPLPRVLHGLLPAWGGDAG